MHCAVVIVRETHRRVLPVYTAYVPGPDPPADAPGGLKALGEPSEAADAQGYEFK